MWEKLLDPANRLLERRLHHALYAKYREMGKGIDGELSRWRRERCLTYLLRSLCDDVLAGCWLFDFDDFFCFDKENSSCFTAYYFYLEKIKTINFYIFF